MTTASSKEAARGYCPIYTSLEQQPIEGENDLKGGQALSAYIYCLNRSGDYAALGSLLHAGSWSLPLCGLKGSRNGKQPRQDYALKRQSAGLITPTAVFTTTTPRLCTEATACWSNHASCCGHRARAEILFITASSATAGGCFL